MEVATPVEAIQFPMNLEGLTVEDLEPMIGRSDTVCEVPNRIPSLTLPMIRRLHQGLGIPADVPIQSPKSATSV
jgi:HTH-type transcriptional regulator/antitoxin HigA